MSPEEKAVLILQEVRAAFARGTRHYDPETGEELTTVKRVLECLRDRGAIDYQPQRPAEN